jgi:RHS repeat-associated protein
VTANLLSGGIDQVFTRTDSSGTANFLTDALGSTLALTNSSGSTLAQYAYEPFGNSFLTSGSSANTYEYTGRENDGLGIYFYRARYYSPTLQRFISEDPTEMLGSGPNLYAYVGGNPVSVVDPRGTDPLSGGVMGAMYGAAGGVAACGCSQGAWVGGAVGAVVGVGVGLIPGSSLVGSTVIGAVSGAVGDMASQVWMNGSVTSWGSVGAAFVAGDVGGMVGGFLPAGWAADAAGGSIALPVGAILNPDSGGRGSSGGSGGSGGPGGLGRSGGAAAGASATSGRKK